MNSPDSNLERTLLEKIPLFAKDYYGYIILEFIPFKIISSVDHLSGGEKISCLKLSGNKGTRHDRVELGFSIDVDDQNFTNIEIFRLHFETGTNIKPPT